MHERPLLSEMPRWLHEWPVRWEALGMRRKGVLVELPSKRALWLMWRAWRGGVWCDLKCLLRIRNHITPANVTGVLCHRPAETAEQCSNLSRPETKRSERSSQDQSFLKGRLTLQ